MPAPEAAMHGPRRLLRSSIGRKVIVAVTGLALVLFLIGHLAGNLLIFSGRDAMNDYAQWLKDHPGLLWSARFGLLAVFAAHIVTAAGLQRENRAARPVAYAKEGEGLVRLAPRSMLLTGLLVLAYVVYHLLHFTLGAVQADSWSLRQAVAGGDRHDVYNMVVISFQHPLVVLSYVIAMGILLVHLSHGVASFFQTLGLRRERWQPWVHRGGLALSVLIVAGFLSIPLSVLLGVVGADR